MKTVITGYEIKKSTDIVGTKTDLEIKTQTIQFYDEGYTFNEVSELSEFAKFKIIELLRSIPNGKKVSFGYPLDEAIFFEVINERLQPNSDLFFTKFRFEFGVEGINTKDLLENAPIGFQKATPIPTTPIRTFVSKIKTKTEADKMSDVTYSAIIDSIYEEAKKGQSKLKLYRWCTGNIYPRLLADGFIVNIDGESFCIHW